MDYDEPDFNDGDLIQDDFLQPDDDDACLEDMMMMAQQEEDVSETNSPSSGGDPTSGDAPPEDCAGDQSSSSIVEEETQEKEPDSEQPQPTGSHHVRQLFAATRKEDPFRFERYTKAISWRTGDETKEPDTFQAKSWQRTEILLRHTKKETTKSPEALLVQYLARRHANSAPVHRISSHTPRPGQNSVPISLKGGRTGLLGAEFSQI
jgi:hypothetical protein